MSEICSRVSILGSFVLPLRRLAMKGSRWLVLLNCQRLLVYASVADVYRPVGSLAGIKEITIIPQKEQPHRLYFELFLAQ